jgi:hypothetical protein
LKCGIAFLCPKIVKTLWVLRGEEEERRRCKRFPQMPLIALGGISALFSLKKEVTFPRTWQRATMTPKLPLLLE